MHKAVFHNVHDGPPAFIGLVHRVTFDAILVEELCRAARGEDGEAELFEHPRCVHQLGRFVGILDREEDGALGGERHACAKLCLQERTRESGVPAHDLTR